MAMAAFPAMGTEVTVVALDGLAGRAAERVRRLFAGWERTLSRFRHDSDLSALNARAGVPVVVGELLFQVLATALRAARATGGAYDPTMLRQLEGLGYDRSFEQVPAAAAPAAAARSAAPGGGWRLVRLEEATRTVTLPAGVGVDLGGIAKGMAVDAAAGRLAAAGIGPAMVNAGGDLRVLGRPPGGADWPIAVDGPGGRRLTVPLAEGAMATSGTGRRRWSRGGERRHHLLDPRTGAPAETGLWSVTVVAPTCAQAEVAAKVAFVLGEDGGAGFLRRTGLPGLFAGEAGGWRAAAGWPAWTLPERPVARC
jgi:thiamine biosynthesis lipoprotein